MRSKIHVNVLGMFYSKTKNTNSNINSILPVNGWANKIVELDIKVIFIVLYKLCIKQLGIITTSHTVCVQHNTTKGNWDVTVQGKLRIHTKNIIDTKIGKEDKQKHKRIS